jgi:trimeric autotransporter adhesin
MDQGGNELYFGSATQLMVYNTLNNGLGTQEPRVPGVVLAVSPDNAKVLVNDQARHLFYLFGLGDSTIATFPGMGNAAQWTPDSQTVYITDNALLNTPAGCGTLNITGHSDALYVFDKNLGWTTYTLPASPLPPSQIPPCTAKANVWAPTQFQTPAITIPTVGAYLRGAQTQAHTWCPSGTVGNQATIQYFPLGDNVAVQSDSLASTVDGQHILGAQWNAGGTITLNDIAVTVPTGLTSGGVATPAACLVTTNTTTGVQTMAPLTLTSTATPVAVSAVTSTSVNQVIAGSTPVPPSGGVGSSLAFITYNGTTAGASLPFYLPPAGSGAGTLGYVPLTGSATITAPVAGAFSPDNTLFFVSTAGDNKVHYISIPNIISGSSQPIDKQQITPNLPACNPSTDTGCLFNGTGTVVPATAIAVKPRSIT